jgi:[acyl-carrier-protein] S-malonyltransferase
VARTSLTQPAIFIASLICWERATAEGATFDFLAGHSLGEYAALVAAESLSFENALRVIGARSEAMQSVGAEAQGGMAAALRLSVATVSDIARRAGVYVANDNAEGQVVLSGSFEGLSRAGALVEAAGGRYAPLDVAGPFHTSAVESAVPILRARLEKVEIRHPRIRVVSNVTARPFRGPNEIRNLLVRNLVVGVRWRESLEWLWAQGVREHEDIGPGKVVGNLAKRTFGLLERSRPTALA